MSYDMNRKLRSFINGRDTCIKDITRGHEITLESVTGGRSRHNGDDATLRARRIVVIFAP